MLQPLESHFSSLVELAPDVLIAPPQVLRRLADALLEGQLELKVEKIVSAAETLDPLDERVIMRAFGGASIHQGYQATEGFLGASCAHGTIHINEDLVHVEPQWLDEASGRFIPVVTDFRRRSQPIVRYRLGDILTQRRTPCPCGSPFRAIESIEGRCDDVFHLAAADGSSRWRAVFPDFVRRAVMTASDELERYLVEQESDGSVVVHLELSEPAPGQPARQGARDAVEASVRDNLAALCRLLDAKLPRLVFSSAIPPLGQRKLRRVVSRFRPENAAERA
jgi:putative adenylate-forming enzyme